MRTVLSFFTALIGVSILSVTVFASSPRTHALVGNNEFATITQSPFGGLLVDRHDGGADFRVNIGSIGYAVTTTELPSGKLLRTSHLHRSYVGFMMPAGTNDLYAIVRQREDGRIVRVLVDREIFRITGARIQYYIVPAAIINLIPLDERAD